MITNLSNLYTSAKKQNRIGSPHRKMVILALFSLLSCWLLHSCVEQVEMHHQSQCSPHLKLSKRNSSWGIRIMQRTHQSSSLTNIDSAPKKTLRLLLCLNVCEVVRTTIWQLAARLEKIKTVWFWFELSGVESRFAEHVWAFVVKLHKPPYIFWWLVLKLALRSFVCDIVGRINWLFVPLLVKLDGCLNKREVESMLVKLLDRVYVPLEASV